MFVFALPSWFIKSKWIREIYLKCVISTGFFTKGSEYFMNSVNTINILNTNTIKYYIFNTVKYDIFRNIYIFKTNFYFIINMSN